MDNLRQFVKNHGYRYTPRYHAPPDSCDFKEARRVVHDFNVAAGAFFKRETSVSAVLKTALVARVHLVRCLLHRVATRAKYGFDVDIGHEGMLRVLLGHLADVNATMAVVSRVAGVPDRPMWTQLQARLTRVVYPRPFATPPRRIARKDYEPQNLSDYSSFYSAIKPEANALARAINPERSRKKSRRSRSRSPRGPPTPPPVSN